MLRGMSGVFEDRVAELLAASRGLTHHKPTMESNVAKQLWEALGAHLEFEAAVGASLFPQRLEQQVPQPSEQRDACHFQPCHSQPRPSPLALGAGEATLRSDDSLIRLKQLEDEVSGCRACALSEHRTQTVFARGDVAASLVFVGEGPGFHEDQQGLPFVGRAGQLLDRMIKAMKLDPQEVYICNVVKCRPPENRTPLPEESAACSTHLVRQLELVRPRVIVALGRCAAQALGSGDTGRWRGVWGNFRAWPVMPTYHPAFLLRSPQFKRQVWEDLQDVMKRLRP